jgi:hypothetical protein
MPKPSPRLAKEVRAATTDVSDWFAAAAKRPEKFVEEGEANLRRARFEVLTSGGLVLPNVSATHVAPSGDYELPGAKKVRAPAFAACANAGDFCSKRGQRCCGPCHARRPGREPRESDFSELGPNSSAYLKLMKLLAILYGVLSVLALPNIIVNIFGGNEGATSANPLATTTLGNVAGVNGTVLLDLPLVGMQNVGNVAVLYSLLDLLMVVVLVAAYFWAKDFSDREAKQVLRLSQSIQEYTVYVPNVEAGTSEADLRKWVASVVSKEFQRGSVDLYRLIVDINEAQAENPSEKTHSPVAASTSTAAMLRDVFAVQQVSIVPSHAVVEAALGKRGALEAALLGHVGAVRAAALARAQLPKEKQAALGSKGQEAFAKRLAVLRVEKLEKGLDLDAVVAQRVVGKDAATVFPSTGAFISFEHEEACKAFLLLAKRRAGPLQKLCSPHYLLRGKPTAAEASPSPAQIIYFNLRFSARQRLVKTIFSNIAAFVVLLVAFGIIFATSVTNQGFQRLLTLTDCSARTFSTFVKFYTTRATPADERNFLKFFPNTNLLMCVPALRVFPPLRVFPSL